MLLKDLLKVYKGRVAIFNYKEEPIYNDFTKKYPMNYLEEKEVVEVLSVKDLLRIKLLA